MLFGLKRRNETRSQKILENYGIDRHYLLHHKLFDAEYYRAKYTVPTDFDGDALDHFLLGSDTHDSDPNEYFDTAFYRAKYNDIKLGEHVPLLHYIKHGASELRDPSQTFSTSWYLFSNPDVAANGVNPLAHFLMHGRHEERAPVKPPRSALRRLAERYKSYGDIGAATLTEIRIDTPAIADRFAPKTPLNVFPDDRLNARPHLNVLIPSLQMRHASGGPNTAFILGILLARAGLQVRFLSTDAPLENTLKPIKGHIERLTGFHPDDLSVELVDACSRERAVPIGRNDIFFATAWWTAQMARSASCMLHNARFLYLIQDYEPLFYGAGENMVDAADTYDLDFFPIINSRFLRNHLVTEKVGKFADAAFAQRAVVFDPAVSQDFFKVSSDQVRRRVLFYARPTIAARNLFGLGVAALRAAIESGVFSVGGWDFVGMGEAFDPIDLGNGHMLRSAPWLGFAEYARQMRESHVLLSLMLSPHPSYPPLEMAACGGKVVTTVFGSKTAEELSALSPNIIGVQPKIQDLVDGLYRAISVDRDTRVGLDNQSAIALPRSWSAALSPVLPVVLTELARLGISAPLSPTKLPEPSTFILSSEEITGSPEHHIRSAARRRQADARVVGEPQLSVMTVIDQAQVSLVDLAHTVLGQTPPTDVDWLIVTVGDRMISVEDYIKKQANVRCRSVSTVLEGICWSFENAKGDYLVITHPDGKLFPDALHSISSFLLRAGLPACAVTRVQLVDGDKIRDSEGAPDLLRSLVILKTSTAMHALKRGDDERNEIQSVEDLVRHVTNTANSICSLDEVLYSLPLGDKDAAPILTMPSAASEDSKVFPVVDLPGRSYTDQRTASISILTLLYHGSDPKLFRETARSVREQTSSPLEWVVLAQGTIDSGFDALLQTLEEEKLLRLVRTDQNRGIAVGLRHCLEVAKGEMSFWLDGDDVLLPNAVEVLASAIVEKPRAVIFYTDEDILIGDEPQNAFHRPDFDPALVLSHSYVYHLIMFQRDLALRLGAFTSDATQFAQDWDILVRFYLAGHEAIHIAEVLVHWRHHAKSTSGSGTFFEGSLNSIKGVLSMIVEQTDRSATLEVAPYPIDLGTPDFYIKRFPINPPRVCRLDFGLAEPADILFPFASVSRLNELTMSGLIEAGRSMTEEFVMLCNTETFDIDGQGIWQADKHFDLISTCVAVGGPITNSAAKVVYGGPVRIDDCRLVDTELGRPLLDPGPFSINLKPHCVDALALDLVVVRSVFLRQALETCPRELALFDFGAWLGAFAQARGGHLVYEPLLRARCRNPDRLFSDSADGLSIASRYPIAKAIGRGARPLVVHGAGGFSLGDAMSR